MCQTAEPDNSSWTISRLLQWSRDYFSRYNVDEPRLCAEVLLAHILEVDRIALYARFDTVPDSHATARLRELVVRVARHEPIAYVIGQKEFFSLSFNVTRDVLIPRPETELLVERTIEYCRANENDVHNILEIGTGSGCIIISVLKHLQNVAGIATDISQTALDVAHENMVLHQINDRLTLLQCDRMVIPESVIPENGFDVLVSNPPYVSTEEMPSLADNVREFEPHMALTDGDDGLSFYRSIALDGVALLRDGGWLALEIGATQAHDVISIFTANGKFEQVGTDRDTINGHERVIRFQKVSSHIK